MAMYHEAMKAIFERKSQLHEFDFRRKATSSIGERIIHISMTYMLVLPPTFPCICPFRPSLKSTHTYCGLVFSRYAYTIRRVLSSDKTSDKKS